jgi:anthranilate synthase/aminodeoxychorismate synthase-like glutamine amidotransferase
MSEILLVDNLDSFSFNLAESLERLGCRVQTVRNSIDAKEAFERAVRANATIVISPGPGRPETAGCCIELIRLARGKRPLIGICLGHQAILAEAGATVERTSAVHGKATLLDHDGAGPFRGLDGPVRVGRYHSLGVRDVPGRFHVHARADGLAMAITDSNALQTGLQFHPESILTRDGDRMLANLLNR